MKVYALPKFWFATNTPLFCTDTYNSCLNWGDSDYLPIIKYYNSK